MNRIFIDTSFIIALYNIDDEYHKKAVNILPEIENAQFILTHAIILEIGNAFANIKLRKIGIEILKRLEADKQNLIIPYSSEIHKQAMVLYESRPDKNWGLTDCVSFVVMKKYGITKALTTDKHFQQAGFKALLLES